MNFQFRKLSKLTRNFSEKIVWQFSKFLKNKTSLFVNDEIKHMNSMLYTFLKRSEWLERFPSFLKNQIFDF